MAERIRADKPEGMAVKHGAKKTARKAPRKATKKR
jgi:hypothetical protein